jgi:ADP-ribosyl-[dinitrogen reductase] hydrolase
MIDNRGLLKSLLAKGRIRLQDGDTLREIPPALPESIGFQKVEGMLLGLAIGDSLGAASEGMLTSERLRRHGEIRGFTPSRLSDWRPVGVPTGDTQLSFWTLEQLIVDRGLIPDNLARHFCEHRIRGVGSTTRAFIRNWKDRHVRWYRAGPDSLDNGALMRVAPILVPHLRQQSPSPCVDAAIAAMITHNSYASNATCVAFVKMLWQLLGMGATPRPRWWADTLCGIVEELEGDVRYAEQRMPLWKHTRRRVNSALRRKLSVVEACEEFGSGPSLFETLPSVLYILAKHAASPEEAIIRAVNDTKDSDTIGAIVGAAVGALHGLKGLPQPWIDDLLGQTRVDTADDGRVFKLLLQAKRLFWLSG